MALSRTPSVRALARGLEVLHHLQSNDGASLHELHLALKLPKPTLLRLLDTLESSGFAWQAMGDRRYHASYHAATRGRPLALADSRLAESSGPVLDWLVGRVRWPSDVSVLKGCAMQLLESSRQSSYFHLRPLAIGFEINMLLSAPGRAYLAFCAEPQRRRILAKLQQRRNDLGMRLLGSERAVRDLIAQTRQLGYGLRDARWGGDPTRPKDEADDGLMAIAAPIMRGPERVLGCVNIVWIARVASPAQVVETHLSDLKAAAELIASRY